MYIFFNSRDELQRIEVSKIVYFEADGNYTSIVMVNKLRASIGMNLGEMERTLAAQIGEESRHFMRIGKRFIINMQYVYSINVLKQQLILSDYDHFAFQISISKDALKKMKELMLVTQANKWFALMDVIIGRDAITSQLNITVGDKEVLLGPKNGVHPSVGVRHCKLTITGKGMRIDNLDINNHTFVNGKEVESKGVSRQDKIELGAGRYLLDWSAIDSFAVDIRPLEQVWNDYEHQRIKLQISERRFNSLRSATGLIIMIAIALSIITGRQSLWYIVLYGVAILISLLLTVKAWKNAASVPQKTQLLSQQFQRDYVCPHCGRFLGNQSFQILSQNDNCPYCKTQFIH